MAKADTKKSDKAAPKKRKSVVDVLAEQTVAAKAAKKAKHSDPVKAIVCAPAASTKVAQHVAKNVGHLRVFLAQYGDNCKFDTTHKLDTTRKIAIPTVVVLNIRGRIIAEIKMLPKATK